MWVKQILKLVFCVPYFSNYNKSNDILLSECFSAAKKTAIFTFLFTYFLKKSYFPYLIIKN